MDHTHRTGEPDVYYERMNIHERLQHHVTWSSFFLLAVTGFMVELPESWLVVFGGYQEQAFYWRGIIHRVAGALMMANLAYQVCYVTMSRRGRGFFRDMLPTFRDVRDFIGNMRYYLKLAEHHPRFDRFNYKEKLEYWTGWIGNIIMSLTGCILWVEELFPKFVCDVSVLVHTMEAILATSAITVWHLYEVHLKPGKFPMSTVWLDGKISAEELEEEHPLQYERLQGMAASPKK